MTITSGTGHGIVCFTWIATQQSGPTLIQITEPRTTTTGTHTIRILFTPHRTLEQDTSMETTGRFLAVSAFNKFSRPSIYDNY